MRYLLDTNICIDVMQRRPASVAARFESLSRGDVGMSIITYAEIRAGIEKRPDSRTHNDMILDLFVQRVPYLPFDKAAAHAYGVLRAAVPDRRRNAMDRLIAAHALGIGATLVTNNENDFKDYPGLVIENWIRDS
jgi:tRNA(fMet)-specific endonuclease VapC